MNSNQIIRTLITTIVGGLCIRFITAIYGNWIITHKDIFINLSIYIVLLGILYLLLYLVGLLLDKIQNDHFRDFGKEIKDMSSDELFSLASGTGVRFKKFINGKLK